MPEISPELAARIQTLEANHAGNPARFFMPLASAYREAGEVGRAEELLRENLKRHPGYLSAHVLLGRCLADRGAYAEARNEFQYVLSVDSQNLIALRTLGDMAAAGGDAGEARRWYGELLAVDPMNAEARQALSTLDSAPPPPAAPAPPAGGEQGGFGMVDIAEHAHEADLPHAGNADPGAWGAVDLDATPVNAAEPAPAPADAGGGFDALDFGAVDLTVADEQPGQAASAEAEAPAPEEAQQPATGGFDAWGSVDDGQDDAATEVEPLPLESFYDEAPAVPEPAPPADEHDEHGEVVTETIAELYARQGFPDRAAEVYRELIARNGDDPALRRRLEELEQQARGESAPAGSQPDDFAIDLDLDLPSAEPASADAAGSSVGWLESVDAYVSGQQPADAGAASGDEVDSAPAGGDLDLPAFDTGADFGLSPAAGESETEAEPSAPEPAAASAGTGDEFADSFADGFDAAPAGRREWEAPTVEETEPALELEHALAASAEEPQAAASASAAESPAADVPAAGAETAGPRVTISSYLTAILSWRPGAAPAAASQSPAVVEDASTPPVESETPAAEAPQAVEDAGAPPPARPWDDETLGAPVEQPPMDEPWLAAGPSAADQAGAADEPWGVEPLPEQQAEEQPWAAEPVSAGQPGDAEWSAPAAGDDAGAAEEPWNEPAPAEPAADQDDEDLPWLSTEPVQPEAAPAEGTEPAAGPPAAGEAPMPWETSFDLSPEVPTEPTAERAPPRQEPEAEPAGGFSFEDFFAEQPAVPPAPAPGPAAPAFEPVPEPQPPAPRAETQAPQQGGGEEDEDLESFQAWLQSLKR